MSDEYIIMSVAGAFDMAELYGAKIKETPLDAAHFIGNSIIDLIPNYHELAPIIKT